MTSPSPLLYDTYYHFFNRGARGRERSASRSITRSALRMVSGRCAMMMRVTAVARIAALLRATLFPLGRPYVVPSDALGHEVAKLLIGPSPTRVV